MWKTRFICKNLVRCRHEPESYIKTLLSYGQKDDYCNQSGLKYGKQGWKIMAELTDKWSFYNMAKPFFKRDVCRVDAEADVNFVKDIANFFAVCLAIGGEFGEE